MSDAIGALRRDSPTFHAEGNENWAVDWAVLDFLLERTPPSAVTLETGSGYSTVIFLTRSKRHIVVSPDSGERRAIERFCRKHSIDTGPLEFYPDLSERVLPSMTEDLRLNVALIDGSHSFPMPILDWYYIADALVAGGLVLVDDIQFRAPRLLRAFLMTEQEWRHVSDIGRTAIFEKMVDGPVRSKLGGHQPWSLPQYPLPGDSITERVRWARRRLRLRSRLFGL